MNCGKYKTENGSTVTITGKHCGIVTIQFDWLEEGGCIDCEPSTDVNEDVLYWSCDYCGGGQVRHIL